VVDRRGEHAGVVDQLEGAALAIGTEELQLEPGPRDGRLALQPR
jgi:hypothetical protein